ncbi:choice-of-anchor J domain-containing protein [Flavobacterium capsici]|uniref:Choice-of-anchor J domain-containing protein n=1 Tax=Flavobacterium capsici TaxID=3075618 RepID=A0AA96EYF8_9FLAO|nr:MULTISPECIES: choice-of-anchor J domain-containing protein [unclassified Flavobacterium]WNM19583.1 choice-of-anchor J domain-containing protein [Flavobacterium sp. PMR2A8]WNM20972.1 choice-of-anchor J domain-containing protein [Flavobacterium sp. PMTSA4]
MKKNILKSIFLLAITSILLASCVKEDDYVLPTTRVPFYQEEFQDIQHDTNLDLTGWTNYAEVGTKLWKERIYQGNGYAEFNTYGSGDAVNIGWLVSPGYDLTGYENPKFCFQSAQNFVSSDENKLQVYVSTDYDGVNVLNATWTEVTAKIADKNTTGYKFIPSGEIDLKAFENQTIYVAFKVTGSGTNTSLDGLFEVDNLYIYTSK